MATTASARFRSAGCGMAAALLAACGDGGRQVVHVDAPEAVTHFALLTIAEGDRLVEATPLGRLGDDAPWWVNAPSGDLLIVGFAQADLLDPMTGALPPGLETDPVRFAERCAPEIGRPRYAARLSRGELQIVAPADVRPLTAAWRESRCKLPEGGIDLDLRCEGPRCVPAVRVLDGCRMSIEAEGCGLGTFVVGYDGDEPRCLYQEAPQRCAMAPAPAANRVAFDCRESMSAPECPLEIVPRAPGSPSFDAATRTFGALPPMLHPEVATETGLSHSMTQWGQAFDIALGGGRVFVSAIDGEERRSCWIETFPRRLLAFDAETLEPVVTATAPPCLEHLAARPEGEGGVAGVFRRGADLAIGLFDRSGRLEASAVLASALGPNLRGKELVPLPSGYAVLIHAVNEERAIGSEIVFVDRALVPLGSTGVVDSTLEGLVAAPPEHVLVTHSGIDALQRIRVPDGSVEAVSPNDPTADFIPIGSAVAGDRAARFGHRDRRLRLFHYPSLATAKPNGFGPPGALGFLAEAIEWPGAPTPHLVAAGAGGDASGGFTAEIFFIDLHGERFLPGRHVLATGRGPVSVVRVDERGRIWALLAWIGELRRLTPRP